MAREQIREADDDLAWCYDAIGDVSRTFSLTVAELDEPMASEVCVGYLLCRVADTVEDAGHVPPADQAALLRQYSRVLDPDTAAGVEEFHDAVEEWVPEHPDDDWRVVANAPRVVAAFDGLDDSARSAMRPSVSELVDGMAMFVDRYADERGLRIRTLSELEEYCWYAAGTVGELVTGLVARDAAPERTQTLGANARSFALLLQLVNVAKDAARDVREENNVYLPAELLREHGLGPADVGDPERADALAPVVERVAERADGYLDGAQTWLEAMPETRGNTLSAWAVPFLLAVGTLRELRARPGDVVREGNVKVSREEVHAVLSQFDGDPPSVAHLRSVMEQQPLHTT